MSRRTKREIMADLSLPLKNGKIVANNTVEYSYLEAITNAEVTNIRLHLTDIISFNHTERTITLDSGGWRTVTTKARMNEFQDVTNVWQEKGIWYCGTSYSRTNSIEFYDGIIFSFDGELLSKEKKESKKINALNKKIKAYCKKIREMKKLPEPSNGDCWFCLFRDEKTGVPWGDKAQDHLISHLDSKYVHGSLIFNALKDAGYQDPSFIFQMDIRDSIARAIARYFKIRLGIAR